MKNIFEEERKIFVVYSKKSYIPSQTVVFNATTESSCTVRKSSLWDSTNNCSKIPLKLLSALTRTILGIQFGTIISRNILRITGLGWIFQEISD